MNKYNYLYNLPIKNYKLKLQSEQDYRAYLINVLLKCEYNTDDIALKNFKDCFTGTMLKKLYNNYDIDKFFLIRTAIVQFPESLIKSLKDELITLLGKSDLELIKETEKLTSIYEFNFLYERIKTDNGYQRIKRDINVSDIYQAIIELDKKIGVFVSNYVENILSNEIPSNEIELLIEMLESNDNQKLFKKFEDNFGFLKNCQIPIIEKLYQHYINELTKTFRQKLKRKINLCGMHEQREKDHVFMDYRHTLAAKGVFNKKPKIKSMG